MRSLRRKSLFIGALVCCSTVLLVAQLNSESTEKDRHNQGVYGVYSARYATLPNNQLSDTRHNNTLQQTLQQTAPIEESVSEVYLWAWPMVYLHNMRKPLRLIQQPGISGGAPVAPINQLAMLTDYISPQLRSIPCPNRDVVYGFGMFDLSEESVVLQVPDFGNRFWIYQVGDQRTDSFASLGSMYHTEPGFYLIAGPNWNGTPPREIKATFRSPTNLAYVLPRVFRSEANENELSLSQSLSSISAYPLSRFNGRVREHNWKKAKWYPSVGTSSREQCKWVRPNTFFDDLRNVLRDWVPLDCEREIHAKAIQFCERSQEDAEFAAFLVSQAHRIESEVITNLFGFSDVGRKLPFHWTTVDNGANFGSDFRTRTAVAKSNIFINRATEAKYFYLEHDEQGNPLEAQQEYQLTFNADQVPATDGFWSLTLYDEEHGLHENRWKRYSVGTKTSELQRNPDGSLTIFIQSQPPGDELESNWLPSPSHGKFVLYLRVYAPEARVLNGTWAPPPVTCEQDLTRLAILP